MKISVLNPGGRDANQIFPNFAGKPGDPGHAPVNFHAFAACTGGGFYRDDRAIPAEDKAVVLLITRRLDEVRQALLELRAAKKSVVVSFKEAGGTQVAEQVCGSSGWDRLRRAPKNRFRLLREIVERADGALATTPDAVPFYRALGARSVEFIPTPYPTEEPEWNFAVSDEERRGIFVGTREFGVPARQHLAAVLMAKHLSELMFEPLTVFDYDGTWGAALHDALRWKRELVTVKTGALAYADYLRLMARHKIVLQLDNSTVPGQVAGDALLGRVICVGGHGTTERLVFPDTCGFGRDHSQLFEVAMRMLDHPHDREHYVNEALLHARREISFAAVAGKLRDFFQHIAR